jgi:serine/threonine protein kinase
MAPEQMSGGQRVTDRADVYAVGVILFLLLTGHLPFEEITRRAPLRAALLDPPDVRSLRAEAPEALAQLVARCLAIDPGARPDAGLLARELAAFADAEGVDALEALERTGTLQPQAPPEPLETLVEAKRTARA